MKCQILFSGENEKNIINLSSVESAQTVIYEGKECRYLDIYNTYENLAGSGKHARIRIYVNNNNPRKICCANCEDELFAQRIPYLL